MPIREVVHIDATKFNSSNGNSKLPQLIQHFQDIIKENDIKPTKSGVYSIVIDYLESLSGELAENKKAFFRDLNGLLRQHPIFIIWPITEQQDVDDIIRYSKAVSGTLFYRSKEVIYFTGPDKKDFPSILKNTISVLNTGYIYSDFQLTEADFNEILDEDIINNSKLALRDYILDIYELWCEKTERINEILKTIPKPTEIWFIFSMPEAEQVLAQFVRKSQNVDECWDAYHAKLDEYIHNGQKAAYWSSTRLQLALSGAFKTKLMFLPTNTLVSCLAAYGDEFGVNNKINWGDTNINSSWYKPSTANRFLKTTPIIKQLQGQSVVLGATRGVKKSLEDARSAFNEINKVASGFNPQRDGSDKPFNKALTKAIKEVMPSLDICAEKEHPWLENINPDITIEMDDKLICLEFHYTKKTVPSAVADYVLKKLDVYMRQIQNKYPKLFS